MNNKKLILVTIALIAAVAVFAGIYLLTRPETSQGEKTITVTVVHGDGTSKDFTCHTDAEFLSEALVEAGILLASEGESGMFFTVDGETASWEENQSYWALFVGEEYATAGANETPVQDGDSFKWVYTIG